MLAYEYLSEGTTRILNNSKAVRCLTAHMYSLSAESVLDVDEKHPDSMLSDRDKTYQSLSNFGMLFRGSVNT